MQLIRPDTNFDFMGRRGLFCTASGIAVLASWVLLVYPGPKYGIDFTGGTQMHVPFGKGIDTGQVRAALAKSGYHNAEVVALGKRQGEFLITVQESSPVSEQEERQARARLVKEFADQGIVEDSFDLSESGDRLQVRFTEEVDVARLEKAIRDAGLLVREHTDDEVASSNEDGGQQEACTAPICRLLPLNEYKYEARLVGVGGQVLQGLRRELSEDRVGDPLRTIYVGPKVGEQLKWQAIKALLYAMGFIMLYIAVRFDLRFAPGAIIALFHDVSITLGIFVLTRNEVSLTVVAALLTIVGYSINDTVVIYDRIRENMQKLRERELPLVMNKAINETLSRTIFTSVATMLAIVAIFVFGGGQIRDFAFAMIIGIVVGTYSSIYIASPLTVVIDQLFSRRQVAG
jgi:preprotein translocase subunit SecF